MFRGSLGPYFKGLKPTSFGWFWGPREVSKSAWFRSTHILGTPIGFQTDTLFLDVFSWGPQKHTETNTKPQEVFGSLGLGTKNFSTFSKGEQCRNGMEQTPLPMFGRSGERLPAVRHDSFLVATVNVRCGNDRIPVATGNCSNTRNGGLSANFQQKFCPKMLPEFNWFEQKVQPKTVQAASLICYTHVLLFMF